MGALAHPRRALAPALIAAALTLAGCAELAPDEGRVPLPEPSAPAVASERDPPPAPAPARDQPPDARVLHGTVTDIVDGDTVKAEVRGFETTIRVIGIDTPETRHPTLPVQCFGPEASAEMARLLPFGQRVRLVSDPTQDLRDRFDRLLAYVYLPGASGAWGSVNHALVASGHARVYVFGGEPFLYTDAFRASESTARAAGRGLWGPPCHGDTERAAPAPAPAADGCDPNYVGACVPPHPADIGCDDLDGPVRVVGADPHRLDGNGDGIGCSG